MKINMGKLRTSMALVAAGLIIWGAAAWPIPFHFSSAIPYCEQRDAAGVSDIQPGDHIQLLYHFWLFRDVIAGDTPVFTNPWEFNIGDDKVVRQFDPYYLPFSAVYAVVSPLLGNAAGWNAASVFSILLGIFGLYLLARRFTDAKWLAFTCAAIGTSFPYRWFTLIGGSPTGFAIGLVPWVFYGIDRAVRDYSLRGGLLAGLAIFFAFSSDLHVFYFSSLASPFYFALSWFASDEKSSVSRLRRTIVALIPFGVFAVLAVAVSSLTSGNLSSTSMSGGRTLSEVKLFSPIVSAVVRRDTLGMSRNIYTGVSMVLLAMLAMYVALRSKDRRTIAMSIVLSLSALGVYLLAVGGYGPFHALPIRVARKLVPKYTMIRQTAKIYCLLPTIFTAYVALALSNRAVHFRRNAVICSAVLLLAASAFVEHVSFFRAGLCHLPDDLPGYRMVAADSPDAHAVSVTLWPGDTHWSSLCEYGAMTSHIKMLNGYSPSVSSTYVSNVYMRVESVNRGLLSNEEADFLQSMGVTHLIFDEGGFVPKTSPYPPGVVISMLASNPRLEQIGRDEQTWVFKIVEGKAETPTIDGCAPFAATYHWKQHWLESKSHALPDHVIYHTKLKGHTSNLPDMRYELLLSGGGVLTNTFDASARIIAPVAPAWVSVPYYKPSGCNFHVADGVVTMHHAYIAIGESSLNGDSFTFPATFLQHRGRTEAPGGAVVFNSNEPVNGIAVYGPDLPFKPGEWEASIELASKSDEVCGAITVETFSDDIQRLAYAETRANGVSRARFSYDGMYPIRLCFHFNKQIESDKPFPIKVLNVGFSFCGDGKSPCAEEEDGAKPSAN